ncbi:MAG: N-methyl-L-tryptophan oxidase [Candidatus Eremiobacteraeota bacterium]|nr:N-methyl-L-tryptophan oxidase [Candidatus Eremiobacteraeota bacterium]
MKRYDAAVIGLGAMGSAAAAHLAARGARVIGLDRFAVLHEFGASAGRSRIIRKAYFEDLAYVPLLERAYELWYRLEKQTGRTLLKLCGVLVVGGGETDAARGVLLASERHGIDVRIMDAPELRAAYPQIRPLDDEIGIFEAEAGIVFPEEAIAAHLDAARANGATLEGNARVTGWQPRGSTLAIDIDGTPEYEVNRVVVCAGPWTPAAFARLRLPITVQRNVQYWFTPESSAFTPDRFPAFFLDRLGLPAPLYGFPDLGDGVKTALHGYGLETIADDLNRDVEPWEVGHMREVVDEWMPAAAGELRSVKACMYALTPDHHFALGVDPHDDRVVFGAGFSGHGFKFAPVIGELLAQLALDGETVLDIDFLSPARFVEGLP